MEIKRLEQRMDMDREMSEANVGELIFVILEKSQKIITSMFNIMQ